MVDQPSWEADESHPEHLRSYEALEQHFRGHLEGLSTTEKGDRFAHFVQRLVLRLDSWTVLHLN